MRSVGVLLLVTAISISISWLQVVSGHNVSQALEGKPEFSTLNTLLTQSGVAIQINSRASVTLLAPPNDILDALIAQVGSQITPQGAFYILSLHVLLDYYDFAMLGALPNRSVAIPSLYQTTGRGVGQEGYVAVADMSDGQIRVGPLTSASNGFLPVGITENVYTVPYTLSIVKIDGALIPPGLLNGPPAGPLANTTEIIGKNGNYSTFLSLAKQLGVLPTLEALDVAPGKTMFIPTNTAFTKLSPGTLDSLTTEQKVRVLKYHVILSFYSHETLPSLVGQTIKTLASGGQLASDYTFTLSSNAGAFAILTGVNSANIGESLYDLNPVSLFSIDAVLIPPEISKMPKPTPAPSSSPSPPKSPGSLPAPKGNHAPASWPVSSPPAASNAISMSMSMSMSTMGGLAVFALLGHLF